MYRWQQQFAFRENKTFFWGEIQLGVVHTMNSCCKLVAAP